MYNYWRSNKNVILTGVALFMVSLTALLYVLAGETGSHSLKANVVDSIAIKSQMEQDKVFRSMVDDHQGPLVVVETHGLIEFSSWDFESAMGYKAEDIKHDLLYGFIHPDDLSIFLAGFGKVLTSQEPVSMLGPYRMRTLNGDYRVHIATLHPIKNEEAVESVIVTILDITEEVEGPTEQENKKEMGPNGESIRNTEEDDEARLVVEKWEGSIP